MSQAMWLSRHLAADLVVEHRSPGFQHRSEERLYSRRQCGKDVPHSPAQVLLHTRSIYVSQHLVDLHIAKIGIDNCHSSRTRSKKGLHRLVASVQFHLEPPTLPARLSRLEL